MKLAPELKEAIRTATPAKTSQADTYITKGGTFMIASPAKWNDSGKPQDLIAIGRFGEVLALSPTVNPDFVEAVKEAVK